MVIRARVPSEVVSVVTEDTEAPGQRTGMADAEFVVPLRLVWGG